MLHLDFFQNNRDTPATGFDPLSLRLHSPPSLPLTEMLPQLRWHLSLTKVSLERHLGPCKLRAAFWQFFCGERGGTGIQHYITLFSSPACQVRGYIASNPPSAILIWNKAKHAGKLFKLMELPHASFPYGSCKGRRLSHFCLEPIMCPELRHFPYIVRI